MGIPQAMDFLKERAAFVKDSLHKSQTITDSMVAILGSFDHRLSALETAMRPTQIKTHSIRRAHENIDKTLKAAELILGHFEQSRKISALNFQPMLFSVDFVPFASITETLALAEAKILRGPHEDLESYLEAIDQLRFNINFFSGYKNIRGTENVLSHANNLLSKAISKLEDEFRNLLTNYSKPVEPDRLFDCLPKTLRPTADGGGKNHSENQKNALETPTFTPPTLIPPRVLPLLHDLAQQMVQAGHQQQLFRIYKDTRAAVLEQSLRKLGVERLSKDDVQKMQWEVLEAKIGNWIHYMRIAVKLLFSGEKKICDQIFEGFDSLRTQCFAEVTANSVAMLLSFGEAIAKSKRSPEKLFVLLDMYEIMRELQSEIETIFGSKACIEMRDTALSLTKRLAQTAQETFGDFEEAVEKDATKTTVLDGTVHPLTSYVINYVKFLYDYQSTLKQLFQEFDAGDPEEQLGSVTTRIMQALQNNLDGKSKQYKDPALTQLFLMNNIHYIVRSVRRSEAKEMLGDDWVQIHRRIVQQHANQYKRISWAKILQCLTVQGGDSNSGVSRASIKDRFKTFNIQFDEIHQRQSQWTVPDSELRESLRLAVAEVLLPAYRSFIKRFGPMIENGKNPQKYIKYSPENLEQMLVQFSPLPQDIEQPNVQTEPSQQQQQQHSYEPTEMMILAVALRLALVGIFMLGVSFRSTQSQSYPPPPHPVPLSFLLRSLTIPRFNISDGELSAIWDAKLTISNAPNSSSVEIERMDAYIWYEGNSQNETLASISPIDPRDLFENEVLAMKAEQEKRVNLRFKTTGWEKDQPIVDDTVIAAMAEERMRRGVIRFGLSMKVKGELSLGEWVMEFDMYPTCSDLEVRFDTAEQGGGATLIRRDFRECSGSIKWGHVRGLL
ncbi:exocyst complex component EXO70A1 [Senna tora]|uniref:Exocyst subunit Exo70 family protein n=1 Tax=Senna tora TaxID=362788 RepID=A0A834W3A3_9FABA|nr:exocyst complex component EXO70A1 [Senna tora]